MKKAILCIIICLLVLGLGYLAFAMLASDGDEESAAATPVVTPAVSLQHLPAPRPGDNARPHFTAYRMGDEAFYQFIELPSVELLHQVASDVEVFSLSETSPGLRRRETISREPVVVIEDARDGMMRLSHTFWVEESMIRFAGDVAELQAYLAQHGVTGEVEYVALLRAEVIWVQAGGKSFFITVELRHEGFTEDGREHIHSYVYEFYTHSEFLARTLPSDGTLIVNGVDITEGNHVRFHPHHDYFSLPLIVVLHTLGVDVQWIDDERISMTYDGVTTILNAKTNDLTRPGTREGILWPPLGVHMMLRIIDGEVIVDSNVLMPEILHEVMGGVEMHVDNEQLTVRIG